MKNEAGTVELECNIGPQIVLELDIFEFQVRIFKELITKLIMHQKMLRPHKLIIPQANRGNIFRKKVCEEQVSSKKLFPWKPSTEAEKFKAEVVAGVMNNRAILAVIIKSSLFYKMNCFCLIKSFALVGRKIYMFYSKYVFIYQNGHNIVFVAPTGSLWD